MDEAMAHRAFMRGWFASRMVSDRADDSLRARPACYISKDRYRHILG